MALEDFVPWRKGKSSVVRRDTENQMYSLQCQMNRYLNHRKLRDSERRLRLRAAIKIKVWLI